MLKTIRLSLLIFSCLAINLTGFAQANKVPSLKGKKVLIVHGGWDGHKPKAFVDKISPWLKEEGADLTISTSLDSYTDEKLMAETDLVIQSWTMGKITKEQVNGLLKAVRNGTGLAGCHGGIGDSFREQSEYLYMVGGQWTAHPGGKINYKVNICDTDDPITKGLSDFKVENTEQYYMLVDPNSKVLATTTFGGEHNSWIDGAVMPIAWRKYYGKGRVYNLAIGHEPKDFDNPSVWTMLKRGFTWAAESKYQAKENLISPVYASNKWFDLVDDNLDSWDVFMGAPHTSSDLEGYEKFEDVRKGTPIGLNKDPKKVFSVIEEGGEKVIRITGEIYAGLVTKKEYENYHLKWQFKWGDKKWEPRLNQKRNSGVLYHSVGDNTDFWNVWMTSLECEVQQTDCGDFITLGKIKAKVPAIRESKKRYIFTPDAELTGFSWGYDDETGRCFKPGDPEKEHGQWNTMELICIGNKSIHVLNGKVVMLVVDPVVLIDGEWKPMNKGKIQIQSEAAEIFYKDMKIKSINEFPQPYKDAAGL